MKHLARLTAGLLLPVAILGCDNDATQPESGPAGCCPPPTALATKPNTPTTAPATQPATPPAALGELIIDVRSKNEYDAGHIAGAILIPVGAIRKDIGKYAPNKDRQIILYCLSGARSGMALGLLMEMGYTNAEDHRGLQDMIDEGYKKGD